MSEHHWTLENLPAYSAGGLPPDEIDRIDRHLADCPECHHALAQVRGLDHTLQTLFTPVQPDTGLEDRLIQGLRLARKPGLPWWAWTMASAAAAVLLALLGAGLHSLVAEDRLMFPGESLASHAQNNLKQLSVIDSGGSMFTNGWSLGPSFGSAGISAELGDSKKYTNLTHGQIHHGPNFKNDFFSTDIDPSANEADTDLNYSVDRLSDVSVPGLQSPSQKTPPAYERKAGKLNPNSNWNEEFKAALNQKHLFFAPKPSPGNETDEKRSLERKITHKNEELLDERLEANLPPGSQKRSHSSISGGIIGGKKIRDGETTLKIQSPPKTYYGLVPRNDTPSKQTLSPPGVPMLPSFPALPPVAQGGSGPTESKNQDNAIKNLEEAKKGQDQPKAPEGVPPPPEGRKIIRTGDIEFEVESFDKASEQIGTLIKGIKGGFVLTTNSEKLPNGKVRGSVVVRMPPEYLDDFLKNLRADLTKMGDLKNQRIGSQDVTKQYTDVESRLRAARTMEERLLSLIKTGKGEVKDLIAAEKELGVWRTRIEEMEGEVRFYNNQVGLSTLTITLVEKEIRAPAALVVTEQVTMGIEVDDVDKAQQATLAAVKELQGRITKSEVKQHAGGKLEAQINLEVAPENAIEMRRRLEKLGTVTHQEAERLQQAQGGTGRPMDLKPRVSDVQFQVALYNIADVPPNETYHLQVASNDVPAAYRKLQEEITRGKGKVQKAELKEEDKLNISAQLDFDIPTPEKASIDRTLSVVGDIVSRSASQAEPGKLVTTRKIGYRLTLVNLATISPREKVALDLEVRNVEQTYTTVLDMVKSSKGVLISSGLSHEKTGQASAQVRFDVPLTAKDDMVRKLKDLGLGNPRLQQASLTSSGPDSTLGTVQFLVTLTNAGPILPNNEGLWQQIRTSLFYSFKLLSWSLMFVILGLIVLLPWALVIFAVYKLVKRFRRPTPSTPG